MKKTKTTIQSLGVILIALVCTSCKIFEPYTLELSSADKEFLVFDQGEHFMLKNEQTNQIFFFTVDTIFFDTIVDGNIITEEVEGYIETATLNALCDSCIYNTTANESYENCTYSIELRKREDDLIISFSLNFYKSDEVIYYFSIDNLSSENDLRQSVIVNDRMFENIYVVNNDLGEQSAESGVRVYFSKSYGIIKVERITTGEILFTIVGYSM